MPPRLRISPRHVVCDIVTGHWHVLGSILASQKIRAADRFILQRACRRRAYAALALGFFPVAELATHCEDGGRLAEHPPANCCLRRSCNRLARSWPPIACGIGTVRAHPRQTFRVFRASSSWRENEGLGGGGYVCRSAEVKVCVVGTTTPQATARSNETLMLSPRGTRAASAGRVGVDGHDIGGLAS
jgi:transketolase